MEYIDSDGQVLICITKPIKTYYCNSSGKLHRLDGPAIEYKNGSCEWFKNGRDHRIGGPAYFDSENNYPQWAIEGIIVKVYYIYG